MSSAARSSSFVLERPPLVTEALKANRSLYYFGLGSNMLRSKLENRAVGNSSKIELQSMQAARVPGYRLAFNLRGFPPLEPGMGSLEPLNNDNLQTSSEALHTYDHPECHGALVKLTPENYEKVMRSEGIHPNVTSTPGYEEIVVTAYPYDSNQEPVQAVALRARSHVRLRKDPCPSVRYMNILREGAMELGLTPCYQEFLAKHPVQRTPGLIRQIAVHNIIFTFTLSALLKGWRGYSKLQSWLLFAVYVPSSAPKLQQFLSHAVSAAILLPGSMLGVVVRAVRAFKAKLGKQKETNQNPMMKRLMDLAKEPTPWQPKEQDTISPAVEQELTAGESIPLQDQEEGPEDDEHLPEQTPKPKTQRIATAS